MNCPQCGADTPDEEWNCVSCRMNVYWASQHYENLAGIRQRQGDTPAQTPSFLLQAHVSAMSERAERGGKVEHKVRQIARRAMSAAAREPAVEAGWKQAEIVLPRLAERQHEEAT